MAARSGDFARAAPGLEAAGLNVSHGYGRVEARCKIYRACCDREREERSRQLLERL